MYHVELICTFARKHKNMSFIGKLAKGFITSAVNQVGRDGGRVISNSLYGDAHATPIRRVGNGMAAQQQCVDVEVKEYDRQGAINAGYIINMELTMGTGKALAYIFYFFCCIMPNPISIIMLIIFVRSALKKMRKDYVFLEKKVAVPNRVPDGRYKGGYRIEGYTYMTDRLIFPANEEEKKVYHTKGKKELYLTIIPFVVSVVFFLIHLLCFNK